MAPQKASTKYLPLSCLTQNSPNPEKWLARESLWNHLQTNKYISCCCMDNSWGKQQTNQRNWEERLEDEMLWGIRALKSSHIFLGIWKSMCILRVGSSSDTIWDGPKLSSVTDLQALHKQNVKAKVNCTLLVWVLKVCCDTHTEPPCNDWKVFGGFLLLF